MSIEYTINPSLSVEDFISLLNKSSLGLRRPIDDTDCMAAMLRHANLIITATDNRQLIGIARSLTDFSYSCYLADLAVDLNYQKQGIGKALIAKTRQELGEKCSIILLSAPKAMDYYPHIGFEKHSGAWILPPDKPLSA